MTNYKDADKQNDNRLNKEEEHRHIQIQKQTNRQTVLRPKNIDMYYFKPKTLHYGCRVSSHLNI